MVRRVVGLGLLLATLMTARSAMADGVMELSLPDEIFVGTRAAAIARYEGDVAGFEWRMGTVEQGRRQAPFYNQRTTSRMLTLDTKELAHLWISVFAYDANGEQLGAEQSREFIIEPVRLQGIALNVEGDIPQHSRVHYRPVLYPEKEGSIQLHWEMRPLGSELWQALVPNPSQGTAPNARGGFHQCEETLGAYEVRLIGVSGGVEQISEPVTINVVKRPSQKFAVDYYDHFSDDHDNLQRWTQGTLTIEHPPMGIPVCNNSLAIGLYLKADPDAYPLSTGYSTEHLVEFDAKRPGETAFRNVDKRHFLAMLRDNGGNPTETYVWFGHPLTTFEGRLNVAAWQQNGDFLLLKVSLSVHSDFDVETSIYKNLSLAVVSDQAYDITGNGSPQSDDPRAPQYFPRRDR